MSEQIELTQGQRDKMLLDMWHAIAGDPLADPPRPGLVATVEGHAKVLFGEQGNNGLVGTQRKVQRWIWMAVGFGAALNIGFAIWIAKISAGK